MRKILESSLGLGSHFPSRAKGVMLAGGWDLSLGFTVLEGAVLK